MCMIYGMSIDYTGLGFTFTTADAAEVLGRREPEVFDLVRAGVLPVLLKPEGPKTGLLRMWFHPDEVSQAEVMLRDSAQRGGGLATDHRNRLRVQEVLRTYLSEVPPVASYDRALLGNAPLLSKTRQRARVVNVRPESVAAHHNATSPVLVTTSMVTAALEFFGAVRVRGVTALAEPGKQRWGIWFRLPAGFAPGADDEADVIEGLLGGAYEDGERVRRRQGGPAYLAEPLTAASDADASEPELDDEELAADRALAEELASVNTDID